MTFETDFFIQLGLDRLFESEFPNQNFFLLLASGRITTGEELGQYQVYGCLSENSFRRFERKRAVKQVARQQGLEKGE